MPGFGLVKHVRIGGLIAKRWPSIPYRPQQGYFSFVLAAVLSAHGVASGGPAIAFRASGTLRMDNHRKQFGGGFTVLRVGERWSITFKYEAQESAEEVVFDGAEVYTMTQNLLAPADDPVLMAQFNSALLRQTNGVLYARGGSGSVSSGPYPYGASSFARCIWLAFLSDAYLAGRTNTVMPVPWGELSTPDAYAFTLRAEFSNSVPPLPVTIAFVADQTRWQQAIRDHPLQVSELPSVPFAPGFIGGAYTATGWTNDLPRIPTSFQVVRFYTPGLITNSMQLPAEKYTGHLEAFAALPGDYKIEPPRIPVPSTVVDLRFRDSQFPLLGVPYWVTNGVWVKRGEVSPSLVETAKDSYASAIAELSASNARPRLNRLVFLVSMLVAASLLGVILLLGRGRRRPRT